MKKALLFVSIALLTLAGCATVSKGADLVGGLGRPGVAAGAVIAGDPDFRPDEVLCATSERPDPMDVNFVAAKVLTPASAATKNQAEVIFLDGKKAWTGLVVPSHKATSAELKLGAPVMYNAHAGSEKLDVDSYRQNIWYIGYVTSVDELFKNVVEIHGEKKFVKWCRIPNQPLK